MLHELHAELAGRGIALRIVGAHSYVRDFLRADGIGDKVGGITELRPLHDLIAEGWKMKPISEPTPKYSTPKPGVCGR